MKTSKILKLAIAFSITLITLLILNTNSVKATNLTKEELQTILDVIPNEITIDIPEIEFENSSEQLDISVKKILTDKNINLENVSISSDASRTLNGKDYFHKATIIIYSGNYSNSVEKTITLNYNNSNKYNSADAQIVNNLSIKNPDYFVMNYPNENTNWDEAINECVAGYYSSMAGDDTIEFKLGVYGGGGNFDGYNFHGAVVNIFKNGIFYDIIDDLPSKVLFQFIIPDNINTTEEAYQDYIFATSTLENEAADIYGTTIDKVTLTKGGKIDISSYDEETQRFYVSKTIDVTDGWTLNVNGNIAAVYVVKKEIKSVETEDTTTGITLDTTSDVVPSNTKLIVQSIGDGKDFDKVKSVLTDYAKLVVFDLSLMSNNQEIQPSGKVKINIPIPEDMDDTKVEVYRIDDNGNKTRCDSMVITINNRKYISFETDHFSLYALAEKSDVSTNPNIANTTETSTDTDVKVESKNDNKGKLDETPKTGNNPIHFSIILITIGLSILAIFILRRSTNEKK